MAKENYITPMMIGRRFEKRVRSAFEKNNYVLIQKNQWNRNYALDKDPASKREFDLVMFSISNKQFYIIECKAHYNNKIKVPKKLVKDFDLKLTIHNGYSAVPMMVTDTDFDKNAYGFAYQKGIHLMNHKQLISFERNSSNKNSFFETLIYYGLESIIKKVTRA